mmetsp:Transcript_3406/g.5310  ORF Transcript_3406/g.5310 Transcript_3406/m.5310 type:complete len:119 (-) Transcript_3406:233-589(-)
MTDAAAVLPLVQGCMSSTEAGNEAGEELVRTHALLPLSTAGHCPTDLSNNGGHRGDQRDSAALSSSKGLGHNLGAYSLMRCSPCTGSNRSSERQSTSHPCYVMKPQLRADPEADANPN